MSQHPDYRSGTSPQREKTMSEKMTREGAAEASIDDLERGTLEHYARISLVAHEWNNQVPQAISAWYAAKRASPQPEQPTSDNAELPGMLAIAKGVAEQTWPHTMDAQVWAAQFNETLVKLGHQPFDPGWLIGWFANAIMAGYDTAQQRAAALSAAQPQAREDRRDAERYRWLRINANKLGVQFPSLNGPTQLDASIDSAMQAERIKAAKR